MGGRGRKGGRERGLEWGGREGEGEGGRGEGEGEGGRERWWENKGRKCHLHLGYTIHSLFMM